MAINIVQNPILRRSVVRPNKMGKESDAAPLLVVASRLLVYQSSIFIP